MPFACYSDQTRSESSQLIKLSANLAKLRLGEVTIRLGGCNCLARQPQTLSEKTSTYAGLGSEGST